MTAAVENAPLFTESDCLRIAKELYGLDVSAQPLPSERDQNFCIQDSRGTKFVLKIANSGESREILNLQNGAMRFLRDRAIGIEVPCVIPSRLGEEIASVAGVNGAGHFVRLLTWIDGVCLAHVKPHSTALLSSLGRSLAEMDLALAGFSHSAMHRKFHWDLRLASTARPHLELMAAGRRRIVEAFLDRWEK